MLGSAIAAGLTSAGTDIAVAVRQGLRGATASRREMSATAAANEKAREVLLNGDIDVLVDGPDGATPRLSVQIGSHVVQALEDWDVWAEGERAPLAGVHWATGPRQASTQHFLSVYDKFVADRPVLREAVLANLRNDGRLNRHFIGKGQADTDDEIRRVIRHATQDEQHLALAAAIDAPVLEAICGGTLRPDPSESAHVQHWFVHESDEKLSQLSVARGRLPHAEAQFLAADLEANPRKAERMRVDARGIREAGLSANRQLVGGPNDQVKLADDVVDRMLALAQLQARLDRVAPLSSNTDSVAPDRTLSETSPDIRSKIHKAIATTIAEEVSNLPHDENHPARILAAGERPGGYKNVPAGPPPWTSRASTLKARIVGAAPLVAIGAFTGPALAAAKGAGELAGLPEPVVRGIAAAANVLASMGGAAGAQAMNATPPAANPPETFPLGFTAVPAGGGSFGLQWQPSSQAPRVVAAPAAAASIAAPAPASPPAPAPELAKNPLVPPSRDDAEKAMPSPPPSAPAASVSAPSPRSSATLMSGASPRNPLGDLSHRSVSMKSGTDLTEHSLSSAAVRPILPLAPLRPNSQPGRRSSGTGSLDGSTPRTIAALTQPRGGAHDLPGAVAREKDYGRAKGAAAGEGHFYDPNDEIVDHAAIDNRAVDGATVSDDSSRSTTRTSARFEGGHVETLLTDRIVNHKP
jgi:hypothetical protein